MKKRLTKSLYSTEWDSLRVILKRLRESRDFTQIALSERLEQPQSFVSKVESGERKLDLRQFVIYVRALDADPMQVFGDFLKEMESERTGKRSK